MAVLRRFSSFVIALALAFAPVALAACEASCASHTTDATTQAGRHSNHTSAGSQSADQTTAHSHHHHSNTAAAETANASAISILAGVPNACSHGADLPVVDGTTHVGFAPPPAILPDIVIPAAASRLIVSVAVAAERSPDPIALTTQLRV